VGTGITDGSCGCSGGRYDHVLREVRAPCGADLGVALMGATPSRMGSLSGAYAGLAANATANSRNAIMAGAGPQYAGSSTCLGGSR
jgi:hypothetical protein